MAILRCYQSLTKPNKLQQKLQIKQKTIAHSSRIITIVSLFELGVAAIAFKCNQ